MKQRLLFILLQALVLSVLDYGLGIVAMSKTQSARLDKVQNEGMRAKLVCARDASTDTMRHMLDLPTIGKRHKVVTVEAFFRVTRDNVTHYRKKLER